MGRNTKKYKKAGIVIGARFTVNGLSEDEFEAGGRDDRDSKWHG